MPLTLRYELEEAGWAQAWIGNGETEIECPVEWESDPIAELLTAACFHLEGAKEESVYPLGAEYKIRFFFGSDGDHVIEFDEPPVVQEATEIRSRSLTGRLVHTTSLELVYSTPPDELVRTVVFRWETTVGEFADLARSIATELLRKHGFREYARRWCAFDFPLAWYARLLMLQGETTMTVALD